MPLAGARTSAGRNQKRPSKRHGKASSPFELATGWLWRSRLAAARLVGGWMEPAESRTAAPNDTVPRACVRGGLQHAPGGSNSARAASDENMISNLLAK